MAALLTKSILNSIANTLYTGATVAFYSVTPTGGETLITTLTDGFLFTRSPRTSRDVEESDVNLILAGDASITQAQLKIAGAAVVTIGSSSTRYRVSTVLPMQQLGAGYVLRLSPQKGAAG